jgi:NDP-sugar pyrophosphorylase family protein
MKAVILAGGKGSRLAPYTKILPKPLMPIGDMPILEILLRQMKRAGVDEVVLTVGHLAELLRAFFQDGQRFGLKITYSYEDCPLGTAGPISLVKGLDDTFLVSNGDLLTTLDIRALVDFHHHNGAAITIASHVRNVKIDLGIIHKNGNNEIVGYTEKPTLEYLVSMGMYVFEPRILPYIGYNRYMDFPDLVVTLIKAGERVLSYPFDGYWMDLGRIDDYEIALRDFEQYREQFLEDKEPVDLLDE